MKEILRNVKINFNTTENIYFKEEFSVPTELKFFSKIVKLYIHNLNYIPIPQNQKINTINNNNNNINNNGYNNNANNVIINNLDNNISNNQSPNNNLL